MENFNFFLFSCGAFNQILEMSSHFPETYKKQEKKSY